MSEQLTQHLIELERTRARGWLTRDSELLINLMDRDFIEINYFGRLTRTQILNELFPDLIMKKFDMEDFKLLTSTDTLAVLSYRADEEITYKGKDIAGVFHVTAVYRKSGKKWLLLIWQITPFTG